MFIVLYSTSLLVIKKGKTNLLRNSPSVPRQTVRLLFYLSQITWLATGRHCCSSGYWGLPHSAEYTPRVEHGTTWTWSAHASQPPDQQEALFSNQIIKNKNNRIFTYFPDKVTLIRCLSWNLTHGGLQHGKAEGYDGVKHVRCYQRGSHPFQFT